MMAVVTAMMMTDCSEVWCVGYGRGGGDGLITRTIRHPAGPPFITIMLRGGSGRFLTPSTSLLVSQSSFAHILIRSDEYDAVCVLALFFYKVNCMY